MGLFFRDLRAGGQSRANVEYIITSDENLAELIGHGAVDPLLGVLELDVHVRVDGREVAFAGYGSTGAMEENHADGLVNSPVVTGRAWNAMETE